MKGSGEGRKQGMPSPCAACELLQRRCAQDCVFTPCFPADEPHNFTNVHKVFGASNVNKMFQENNRDEGARGVSSAGVVVAREFFPLVPDRHTKEVSDHLQEIVPAQPKRKSRASLTDADTLIVEKKAKYKRTQKGKKEASGCDTEEVSTELVLLFDPYKIKKKLTPSDLSHLSRLLIGQDFVKSHFLRWMSEETARQVESGKGADVIVRDVDTCSEHRLVFMFWASSRSYVLKGGWIKEFAKRRGLAVGDEIGLYWDSIARKFHFSLLHKAN